MVIVRQKEEAQKPGTASFIDKIGTRASDKVDVRQSPPGRVRAWEFCLMFASPYTHPTICFYYGSNSLSLSLSVFRSLCVYYNGSRGHPALRAESFKWWA